MVEKTKLYTISAAMFGLNNTLYRVKVTQTFICDVTSKYWCILEDADGNILSCALHNPPLNTRVTYNDLKNLLEDAERNVLGIRKKIELKKRWKIFLKPRRKL